MSRKAPGSSSSPGNPARDPLSLRRVAGDRIHPTAVYAVSVISVLLIWEFASRKFDLTALFPPPVDSLRRFGELTWDGTLENAAAVSMLRIVVGWMIGSVAGMLLGMLMGSSVTVRILVEPYMNFFRFIPPLAWFAPVLLLFGTGEEAKILLIVYTTVFVVAINTMDGVASVSTNKRRMAQMYGATRRQLFVFITLPGSMPFILTGMRLAMGNAFMTIVAAEMLAANNGLGYLLLSSQIFFDISAIFAGCIALGMLGFATDRFFRWLAGRWGERYLVGQASEQ